MKVELQYFRRSGKWYSDGDYETSKALLSDIWNEVREFQAEGKLPGLIDSPDGRFEFIISVDVPDHLLRHPHLIV